MNLTVFFVVVLCVATYVSASGRSSGSNNIWFYAVSSPDFLYKFFGIPEKAESVKRIKFTKIFNQHSDHSLQIPVITEGELNIFTSAKSASSAPDLYVVQIGEGPVAEFHTFDSTNSVVINMNGLVILGQASSLETFRKKFLDKISTLSSLLKCTNLTDFENICIKIRKDSGISFGVIFHSPVPLYRKPSKFAIAIIGGFVLVDVCCVIFLIFWIRKIKAKNSK